MQEQQQEFIVTAAATAVSNPNINQKVAVEILIALLILLAIVLFLVILGPQLFRTHVAGCTSLQSCMVNA